MFSSAGKRADLDKLFTPEVVSALLDLAVERTENDELLDPMNVGLFGSDRVMFESGRLADLV